MLRSAVLSVLCVGLLVSPGLAGEEPKEKKKPAPPAPQDVIDAVRYVNSKAFTAPPTKFRAGHVTARQLPASAVTRTERGFSVKLPANAPVPTPTVSNGRVFVSGGFHSKEYFCFDAKTGALRWGINLDDDGPTSAVVEDDVVVFNTESCTVFAVDANTGKQLWSLWLGDPLLTTPTIANGIVFTSYPAAGHAPAPQNKTPKKYVPPTHVLGAFELKTGKILWQRWIDSDVMSAPIAVGKVLYATSFSGTVYMFDQATGKVLSAVKQRATSAPIVANGRMFLSARIDGMDEQLAREALRALSTSGRSVSYEVQARKAEYLDRSVQAGSDYEEKGVAMDAMNGFGGAAPAAANAAAGLANIGQGRVSTLQAFQGSRGMSMPGNNFNTMGDELVCTDPVSGATRWAVKIDGDLRRAGGFLASSPAAAGGFVFIATLKGEVLRIDPADGKIAERYAVASPIRSQPAIVGGRIYVGTQDGRLVCIDTGKAAYDGWSTWGGNAAHTGVVESKKAAPRAK